MALSKRTTDVVVGVFLVLGTAAIVGATMWARQVRLGHQATMIAARFRDVGGASVGTNVYMRGIRAGRIAALELGDDGWVRARIALEPSVRLPDDPAVVLGAASVVGEWQATILPRGAASDDPEVRRQLAEARGEPAVLPGATLPDARQFSAAAGRILEDVGAVAGQARAIFDDAAARELRVAVSNASTLSTRMVATTDALRRTAAHADSATAGGELERTVHDAAAAAVDLRTAAAELRSLAGRGGATAVVLDRVLARMDTLVARTAGGAGTLGRVMNDPALYANTDSLVTEMRGLVSDVKAHPQRYVTIRVF